MRRTEVPRVKVCCIASIEEAWLAIQHGAAALGLVSAMPSGPGPIDEALIATIAAAVPPPISAFLLTSQTDPEAIIDQQRRCGVDTLQLVDAMDPRAYPVLRRALPGVRLVQVVHVTGPEAVGRAMAVSAHVDAILLDSGRPDAEVRELGGTGRVHDWAISREIRARVPVPMFLAGGLNPDNVQDAVREVGPFGLDTCSGLRVDGKLDPARLQGFVRGARTAYANALRADAERGVA